MKRVSFGRFFFVVRVAAVAVAVARYIIETERLVPTHLTAMEVSLDFPQLTFGRQVDPSFSQHKFSNERGPLPHHGHVQGQAFPGNDAQVSLLGLPIWSLMVEDWSIELCLIRANPVFDFVLTSASLRLVSVYGKSNDFIADDRVIRRLLQSIVQNPSILVLNVDANISPFVFGILDGSFQSLEVEVNGRHQSALVTTVLMAHRTLQQLSLSFYSFGLDGELTVIESVLYHPTLCNLKIAAALNSPIDIEYANAINATSALLEDSASKLESLSIEFHFDENGAERFVEALRQNESLKMLTFASGKFDDEAISVFFDYLMDRDGSTGFSELTFFSKNTLFFETEDCFPGERIAQFVNGQYGAGAKVLGVKSFASLNGFWSGLNAAAMNDSRMLQCVKLPTVNYSRDDQVTVALRNSQADMLRIIPHLLHLCELWIGQVPSNVGVFMEAMKKNSSLHDIRFNDDVAPFDQLNVVEHLLVAFGERNANLPALLVGHQQLESNGMYTSSLEDSTIRLLPQFLSAAQQMPGMAPTYMLSALLASFNAVGPTLRIN
jgi:hypothetical protein